MDVEKEILFRMKKLDMHEDVIRDFKNNILNKSFGGSPFIFWLSNKEEKMVKEFEKNNINAKVYHIIETVTSNFDVIYDLLYITNEYEKLNRERRFLEKNIVLSYTVSRHSKSGFIKIKKVNGGVIKLC